MQCSYIFENQEEKDDVQIQKDCELLDAVVSGNLDKFRNSLIQKASIHSVDKNRNTPLHWASYYGFPDIADILILSGAHIDAKNDKVLF